MAELIKLPLVPLKDVVVFPGMIINFDVGRDAAAKALEAAMTKDRRVFLVPQTNVEEDLSKEVIYRIGTISEIRQLIKLPDGNVRVIIEGIARGIAHEFQKVEDEKYIEVSLEEHAEVWEDTVEVEALMRCVIHKFENWMKVSKRIPNEVFIAITVLEDFGKVADLISGHLSLKLSSKRELLVTLDLKERLDKLHKFLIHELEISELENEISQQVHEQIEKLQKDHYLREQIKAIHKELGEDENFEEESTKYREKLESGDYPEEVKEIINKELIKLSHLPTMAQEGNIIRNYIEWLINLPWKISTIETTDIANASKILERDHYGLEKVKERILDFLAVKVLTKDKPAPILCLVGPPGVGKTSLASSVARATGRKFIRASLGGVRDEAEIRGHRRTYLGAMPGKIIQEIKKAGTNNPVFLLDEVDKIGRESHTGNPSAALLEVLDPAQNNTFDDHYINAPFDLSKVMWIVTANNLSNIPKALRDRMEIIVLSSYTEVEKFEIARKYLVKRQKEMNGLKNSDVLFGKGVLQEIIAEYTREAGVRELERIIGRACRKAARQIVEGHEGAIHITKKNLVSFIGRPKFLQTRAEKQPQIGVSTGMAWTEVGGTILPIETTILKGNGKLLLTGQLGDVMQESAQAGLTYVRSRSDLMELDEDFYNKNDIHIHVPEGAIPKDGPSAGITMATSMVSALTKKKVRSDVAMTGEITLRGNVLAIGGLKEKVLAAYREGMRTIILPKENTPDIEDIPKEVRKELEFVPVENMDEVLKTALIK